MGAPLKKTRFVRLRIVLLAVFAVFLCLPLEPHIFRSAVKFLLINDAKKAGISLNLKDVEGNIFEPVVLRGVSIDFQQSGVASTLALSSVEANLNWLAWIFRGGAGFFERVALDDAVLNIEFNKFRRVQPETGATDKGESKGAVPEWLKLPKSTKVSKGKLVMKLGDHSIVANDFYLEVNEADAGELFVRSLEVNLPSLKKAFTQLKATTAVQGSRLALAHSQIDKDVWLERFSLDLGQAVKGIAKADFDLVAFNGFIRGELSNSTAEVHAGFDVAGTFSKIAVKSLSEFLGVQEKTDGVIKEGKFTFRGSLEALEEAAISTRLEATNFLWGSRQWNSLVLGATLLNRQVDIHELQLRQENNSLQMKGRMVLPTLETPWWKTQFSFDVAGKINDLAELSALFGPRFAETQGVVTVDGSIRGQDETFSGQLSIAGSKLSYKGVPIDVFNAAIKLEGNELQIAHVEITHKGDFIRGSGVVNILGEKRYWGEVKASIGDLEDYTALLEPPIAPAPLSGGVIVDWSGDGTPQYHSGTFSAHFDKLCVSGSNKVLSTLPIDADLQGSYSPGNVFLSKCSLANKKTLLETSVALNKTGVHLDWVKVKENDVVWLEGEASLPVNVFQWWASPSVNALLPDAPFEVKLVAKKMSLDNVARLSGRPVPIRGVVSGNFQTAGTLRNLKMNGTISLSKGMLPANKWLPALDDIQAEAILQGETLEVSKMSLRIAEGNFEANGRVDFSNFELPTPHLNLQGKRVPFSAGEQWRGFANLDLLVSGTEISGRALVTDLENPPKPDFGPLIQNGITDKLEISTPVLQILPALDKWSYNIALETKEPLKLPSSATGKTESAKLSVNLLLAGKPDETGKIPASGSVTYLNLPVETPVKTVSTVAESASFLFSNAPTVLSARFVSKIKETGREPHAVYGSVFGPLNQLKALFVSTEPQTEEAARQLFAPGIERFSSTAALPAPEGAAEKQGEPKTSAAASPSPEVSVSHSETETGKSAQPAASPQTQILP